VPKVDHLPPSKCTEMPNSSSFDFTGSLIPMYVCEGVTLVRIGMDTMLPSVLQNKDLWVSSTTESTKKQLVKITSKPNPTHSFGYQFTVAVNYSYSLKFDLHAYNDVDPNMFRINSYELGVGDFVHFHQHLRQWQVADELGRELWHLNVGGTVKAVNANETMFLTRPDEDRWRGVQRPVTPFSNNRVRRGKGNRLELAINASANLWGTVCDNVIQKGNFPQELMLVTCRSLGYSLIDTHHILFLF
jgi:hypothetical protein